MIQYGSSTLSLTSFALHDNLIYLFSSEPRFPDTRVTNIELLVFVLFGSVLFKINLDDGMNHCMYGFKVARWGIATAIIIIIIVVIIDAR